MLPSNDDIKRLTLTGDAFKHAVIGFSAIETALDKLISDSMAASHRVELKRMSVGIKVDLAIALGLLSLESKGLLLKLSKVRNFYAHEFSPEAEFCTAAELKACFGTRQRALAGEFLDAAQSFTDTLRVAFIAAYYDLIARIEQLEAKKRKREDVLLHIEAVLAVTGKPLEGWEGTEALNREISRINEKVEAKKKELRERGGGQVGKEAGEKP